MRAVDARNADDLLATAEDARERTRREDPTGAALIEARYAELLEALDWYLDAGQPDRLEPIDQPHRRLGLDAPRAPVGDEAGAVHGAEVPACGHVPRAQIKLDAEGFEDSAADLVGQRVVAEQPEVPRPAPRRDARCHVPQ